MDAVKCRIKNESYIIKFNDVPLGRPFIAVYGGVPYLKHSKNTAFCFKSFKNERFPPDFRVRLVGEMVIAGRLA